MASYDCRTDCRDHRTGNHADTFTEEEKNDPLQQLLSDRNIGFFYEEALSFPGQAQHELYTLHGLPESL